MNIITLLISVFSLVVSITVVWLTLLRKGTLKMTQPTLIFFGKDGPTGPQKVVLRTLLYSTARQGHIVENMFLRLRRGEVIQDFNYWAYGDNSWVRGSGLRVGYEGVSYYHHFLLHEEVNEWEFTSGDYILDVFASLVNSSKPLLLSSLHLSVSDKFAKVLHEQDSSIFFDWLPDPQQYHSRLEIRPDKNFTVVK